MHRNVAVWNMALTIEYGKESDPPRITHAEFMILLSDTKADSTGINTANSINMTIPNTACVMVSPNFLNGFQTMRMNLSKAINKVVILQPVMDDRMVIHNTDCFQSIK